MYRVCFKFRHFDQILDADLIITTAQRWRNCEEATQSRWSVASIGPLRLALRLPTLPNFNNAGSETDRSSPLGADSHVDGNGPDLEGLIGL
jgi:hypothetical protein